MLVLEGHKRSGAVQHLGFALEGRALVSASEDGNISLWDLSTQAAAVLVNGLRGFALASDGTAIAWGGGLEVRARQLTTGQSWALDYEGVSWYLAFSPDGRWLAIGDGPSVWDVQTGKLLCSCDAAAGWFAASLAFSPDGCTLAASSWTLTPSWNSCIRLFDSVTSKQQTALPGYGKVQAPASLQFSPDGRLLAGVCGAALCVWDVQDGEPVWQGKVGRKHFQSVAFTPDGRFLAATSNDSTARFWDTASWGLRASFDWEIGPLVSLAIAPDGMRAAAGSKKGKIVVWDLDL